MPKFAEGHPKAYLYLGDAAGQIGAQMLQRFLQAVGQAGIGTATLFDVRRWGGKTVRNALEWLGRD